MGSLRSALQPVARTLDRDAHVLRHQPRLVWQQLHNRLQWQEGPLAQRIAVERERRSQANAPIWIRLLTPSRQSTSYILSLEGHERFPHEVVFSPNGSLIGTAADDWTARLWDARTGSSVHILKGGAWQAHSLAFNPDGTRIATTDSDSHGHGMGRVWDTRTGEHLRTLGSRTDISGGTLFSPDGTRIAAACTDATVRIWDAGTGECLHTLDDAEGPLVFDPGGTQIVTTSSDPTARLWDVANGALLHRLEGHTDPAWLVTAGKDGRIRVWDVDSG